MTNPQVGTLMTRLDFTTCRSSHQMELLETNALELNLCDFFYVMDRKCCYWSSNRFHAFMLTPNIYALFRIDFAMKRGIG